MPPGRNVCAFKDLKRATHVSLYQQNLQSKKRRAAIKLQLQAGDTLHDHTIFFFKQLQCFSYFTSFVLLTCNKTCFVYTEHFTNARVFILSVPCAQ